MTMSTNIIVPQRNMPKVLQSLSRRRKFKKLIKSRKPKGRSSSVLYNDMGRLTYNSPLHGVLLFNKRPVPKLSVPGMQWARNRIKKVFSKSAEIKAKHGEKQKYLKNLRALQNNLSVNHSAAKKQKIANEMQRVVMRFGKKQIGPSMLSRIAESVGSIPKKVYRRFRPPPPQATEREVISHMINMKRMIKQTKASGNKEAEKKWTRALFSLKKQLQELRRYNPLLLK